MYATVFTIVVTKIQNTFFRSNLITMGVIHSSKESLVEHYLVSCLRAKGVDITFVWTHSQSTEGTNVLIFIVETHQRGV